MPIPLRKYSQNWLANDELAVALVSEIKPRPGDHVLEIGPGEGRLTRALLRYPISVTAVELDPRCAMVLRKLRDDVSVADASLTVIEQDVLEFDPGSIAGSDTLRLVGNLPYAITSPILRWTVKHRRLVEDAHYMIPTDIAQRLLAPPGASERGLITVMVGWFYETEAVRRLGPGAFRPQPKIESSFIRLRRREPPVCNAPGPHRRAVVSGAFAHKRKKLRNSLQQTGWSRDDVTRATDQAGIAADARAEAVSIEEFARLIDALPERKGRAT